jgi:hypothetical protein
VRFKGKGKDRSPVCSSNFSQFHLPPENNNFSMKCAAFTTTEFTPSDENLNVTFKNAVILLLLSLTTFA